MLLPNQENAFRVVIPAESDLPNALNALCFLFACPVEELATRAFRLLLRENQTAVDSLLECRRLARETPYLAEERTS